MHAESTDCLLLQDILGWGESDRGVSYTFGRDIVQEFLETHNLSLICRAHQVNSLVSDSAVPYHRISHCSLYCYVVYNDSLGPRGLWPGCLSLALHEKQVLQAMKSSGWWGPHNIDLVLSHCSSLQCDV